MPRTNIGLKAKYENALNQSQVGASEQEVVSLMGNLTTNWLIHYNGS